MKETQEFTGKDVNAAIANACKALGLSKTALKYEVVSQGTSGIFGIVGRKDAKIKVFLPKEAPKASDEEMAGILSIVDEAFGQETRRDKPAAPPTRTKAPEPKPPAADEDLDQELEEDFTEDEALEEDDGLTLEEEGPWQLSEAEEGAAEDDEDEDEDEDYEDDEDEDEDNGIPPVPVTQASIDLGLEALGKMVNLITDEAKIEAMVDQDRLTLQISGGNVGILIGRKGQTLDAMQFLADKIINRQSEARVRVKVDVEGYMETRKTNLRQLAFKMAEKAKKTGRPATINQMSAQDRRIVHLALKDDSQVRTQSMGDGYYRRLVIFPKKRSTYRGKRRFKRNDR